MSDNDLMVYTLTHSIRCNGKLCNKWCDLMYDNTRDMVCLLELAEPEILRNTPLSLNYLRTKKCLEMFG